MCIRCQCTDKRYINVLRTFIQFVSASAACTHAWSPEKKRLILYWTTITHSPTWIKPVLSLVLQNSYMLLPWIRDRTLITCYHGYVISNYCNLWTWIRYLKTIISRDHGYVISNYCKLRTWIRYLKTESSWCKR